ncbi:hypothetical protein, partial [Vibrio cholerae]|uniref:hypothetical protein n=1 Tax=Vibrio cholerae TaxID=666 RepID=UPI0030801C06
WYTTNSNMSPEIKLYISKSNPFGNIFNLYSFAYNLLSICCRFIGFLGGYVIHSSSLKSMLLVDFCDEKYN